MPEELWTEVRDIVQEAVIKTISKKKKCKKAKQLSKKALQTGKIGDLVKKIRDTKGTLHTKMGRIKDKNS